MTHVTQTRLDHGSLGASEAFVVAAATALQRLGSSAHELEATLAALELEVLGPVQVFATPTSVELAFGRDAQRTRLLRVEAGEAQLGPLVELHQVIAAVASGSMAAGAGLEAIEAIAAAPPRFGRAMTLLAFAAASAGAARFLSGSLADVIVAGGLGLLLGALALASSGRRGLGRVFPSAATFVAAGLSAALTRLVPGLNEGVTTLAAIIVLVPGLSLTLAMGELATRHLVAGTARFAGAMHTFVTMALGVALSRALVDMADARVLVELRWALPELYLAPMGEPSRLLALILAPIGFCVLFQARWRDAPAIALTGVLAAELARVVGAGSGPEWGPELGAFAGAMVVGLGARLYANWAEVPRAVVLLPGLLLLVPGSVGFRGVTALLAHDPSAGIEGVFRMLLVAVALVAGVLVVQGADAEVEGARS